MSNEEEIKSLLSAFCNAMHAWELNCRKYWDRLWVTKKHELDESDMVEERRHEDALREVFKLFCVSWENPERGPTAPDPPSYHPDYFDILEVRVKGKKATAKVRQPQLSYNPRKGPGIFEVDVGLDFMAYHLRLTEVGWRLEDRRESHHKDGKVFKMGL